MTNLLAVNGHTLQEPLNLRSILIHPHRHPYHLQLIVFIIALSSLTLTPPFIPLVVLLSSLLLHAQIQQRSALNSSLTLWPLLTLATALTHLHSIPSHIHLQGFIGLIVIASSISGISLFAILGVHTFITRHQRHRVPAVLSFPAIWSTTLLITSNLVSPLGRLALWSPLRGVKAYEWMIPIWGPIAVDWVVAAWAAVLAEFVGAWVMISDSSGENDSEHEHEETVEAFENGIERDQQEVEEELNLISPSVNASANAKTRKLRFGTGFNQWFAIFLLALSVPSYFLTPPLPLLPQTPLISITPLTVACVLPDTSTSKSPPPSALDNYITESAKLTRAKLILWPESSVYFNSGTEKNLTIEKVRSRIKGPYVVVGFEQGGFGNSKRKNGVMVIDTLPNATEGAWVVGEYFKRNLVPIAESFSIIPSTSPPPLINLQLPPPSGTAPTKWNPNNPKHTRNLPITLSICLDFTSPTQFLSLSSDSHSPQTQTRTPSLILAPAKTWHPSLSDLLFLHARMRALEMGVDNLLFCDSLAEEGGWSGLGDGGVRQVGGGSWMKNVGVLWDEGKGKDNEGRGTIYGRYGAGGWSGVVVAWAMVVGVGVGSGVLIGGIGRRIVGTGGTAREWIVRKFSKGGNNRGEDSERLLIDVED